MSDEQGSTQELKHVERLNIGTLSIDRIKDLIKDDILLSLNAYKEGLKIEKSTFHIIGPAGVGKTQICYQIAEELSKTTGENFELIIIKAPVLSRDDMIIPFPVVDNGNTSFKMLYSDFIPRDKDSYGIFVIDEFSRGDHAFQQLMWQVQNEHKIHLMDFPKNWFVISVDNPDDAEYSMDILEDAAGLRRMIHIYTEVTVPSFLRYAKEKEFHEWVINYITARPERLYDFDAQKKGSVFSNPASFEKLSDQLKKFELAGGVDKHYDAIDIIASGLLNASHAKLFLDFYKYKKDITPQDIFHKYKTVRKDVLDIAKKHDNAKLGELAVALYNYLTTSTPGLKDVTHKDGKTTKEVQIAKEEVENFVNFVTDIPVDTAAIFATQIDKLDRQSSEYVYMTKLHLFAHNNKKYVKEFYEKLVNLSSDKD